MEAVAEACEKRQVFIIGSKGIPASYGGFETFVDRLTLYSMGQQEIQYHVSCITDRRKEDFSYHGARCFSVKVPDIGAAKAVLYDIKALRECLRYIQKNQIKQPIIYILACRVGPVMAWYQKRFHRLDGFVCLNPDGHEWLRAKWNWLISQYWKISEWGMVKHADLVICDSKGIERYIQTRYARFRPVTTFVAYGAEQQNQIDETKLSQWLREQKLQKESYYLVVGRLVPENNYREIIHEFMKTSVKKDLVLVTTQDEVYMERLKVETGLQADPRIHFVGSIYDNELLTAIRKNAFAYIHGHEVGGTNPSLLEAMSNTKVNLLFDVIFNKEVGGAAALYWNKSDIPLSQMIYRVESMHGDEREWLGQQAKVRMKQYYSWEEIAMRYHEIFTSQQR